MAEMQTQGTPVLDPPAPGAAPAHTLVVNYSSLDPARLPEATALLARVLSL